MKSSSKYGVKIILLFLMPFAVLAQAVDNPLPALIPLPVEVKSSATYFYINQSTKIIAGNNALNKVSILLNGYIIASGGKRLTVTTTEPTDNFISMEIDTAAVTHAEGYRLVI